MKTNSDWDQSPIEVKLERIQVFINYNGGETHSSVQESFATTAHSIKWS